MRKRSAAALVLAFAFTFTGDEARGGGAVRMRLDVRATFQTWEAWSCMPNPPGYWRAFRAWRKDPSPATYDRIAVDRFLPGKLIAKMHDALVFDLGITRMRLAAGPQMEPVNDDGDPMRTDPSAFRFAWQDDQIERHFLPLKERIEKTGERATVYVSYDLKSQFTPPFLLRPAEYAEMAAAFVRHVDAKFAFQPDYWSVMNEPGNQRPGDPYLCAELTAATGSRLAAAGFRTKMSGPECVTLAEAPQYMQAMSETPGALDHFRQITYHLYHGSADDVPGRNAVRAWARKLNVTAAQTEWMDGTDIDVARHVLLCLTEADATVWDRYGSDLFFALRYDDWLDPKSDERKDLPLSSTAWHIRQFSRYIRPGAVRVALTGGADGVKGVAFTPKAKGLPVVVLLNNADESRTVELDSLPAGTYGRSFTSVPRRARGEREAAVEVGAAGRVTLELPAKSVTTLADPAR